MMAGSKTLPSKGRIQMSQTNYLQIVKSGLQRTAGPYRSAMCGRLRVGKSFFTFAALVGAAMCSAFKRGTRGRWP